MPVPTRHVAVLVLLSCCAFRVVSTGASAPPFSKHFYFLDKTDELDPNAKENEVVDETRSQTRRYAKGPIPPFQFREPLEADYFGNGSAFPRSPPRLTNTTLEEFAYYARLGIPVVVTDAARDWPLLGLSCKKLQETFGKERMRQEYTDSGARSINDQTIGDSSWMTKMTPIENGPKGTGPDFAPWYWDFKDNPDLSRSTRKKMLELTRKPYFMPEMGNLFQIRRSGEFWFSAPHAGAKSHSDEHCDNTMSVQLYGRKRWRFGMLPQLKSYASARRYRDGDVDTAVWQPEFDFVLEQGEGVFFPPGIVHETDNAGDECAASATYQWDYPAPSIYLREFLPRLTLDTSVGQCMQRRGVLVTMSADVSVTTTKRGTEQRSARIFEDTDVDQDGFLSRAEIRQRFDSMRGDDVMDFAGGPDRPTSRYIREGKDHLALDALFFHDLDGDGRVSREEFEQNFLAWTAMILTRKRARGMLNKFLRRKDGATRRCGDEAQVRQVVRHALSEATEPEAATAEKCGDLWKLVRDVHRATSFQVEDRDSTYTQGVLLAAKGQTIEKEAKTGRRFHDDAEL